MVPIGAIVAAVVVLVRVLNKNDDQGPTASAPAVSRGTYNWLNDGFALTFLLQLIAAPAALSLITGGLQTFNPVLLVSGLLLFTVVWPWLVCRWVLIPFGLARAAFAVASLSRFTFRSDKPGGPAMAAALALVWQQKPSAKTLAWVQERLANSTRCLQPSGVAAHAYLLAAQGRLDDARTLLNSLLDFDDRLLPRAVRIPALHWQLCDAAARGAWNEVLELCGTPSNADEPTSVSPAELKARRQRSERWGFSRAKWLFDALAKKQLQRSDAPGAFALWFFYWLSPRRLWTWSFVRQTLSARPRLEAPGAPPRPAPPPTAAGPVGVPLQSHLLLTLEPRSPRLKELSRVARAWESALDDPSLKAGLAERVVALNGGEVGAALEKIREQLEQAFSQWAENAEGALSGELPPLLDAALSRRREGLYQRLDQTVQQLERRKQEQRELPAFEEWRESLRLRALYEELVKLGGPSERQLAHGALKDTFTNFAVWLYNSRRERPVAVALFSWLRDEAARVGDDAAYKLNEKNAKCDL